MNEYESFGELEKEELNAIYDVRREQDIDFIDVDVEYQKRELKRINGEECKYDRNAHNQRWRNTPNSRDG